VKKAVKILPVALIGALLAACGQSGQMDDTTNLESLESRVNYGLGYNYASQLLQSGIELDAGAFTAGVRDAAADSESRLTDEELQAAFEEYQANLQAQAEAEQESMASENLAEANAFLAENAQAEGVMTTASGLQYKILEEGTGPKPTTDSTVQVHYEGRLLDGTVFDSSYQRGEPVDFGVTQVIPGWTEALQMMPEGSKWQLFIPPNLGYGASGAGGVIGPNSLLIFDVELIQANYTPDSEE
jgi:FKBP-type peptidyl-prolyl cis-trans isomerase